MKTAVEWLQSLPRLSGEPGLDRMRALLKELGDPHKNCKYVHVAGTNGKGTVSSLTANILKKAGYKTGLTLSPYVLDFRERFQINGEMISPEELEKVTEKVRTAAEKLPELPAQFEAVTAVAFVWFSEQACDLVVLETGLGGRYDATNVVENTLVAAITRIDLDHTELLGDTLEKIASEKAGIIKPGCVAVSFPAQDPEAFQVIAAECIKQKADLVQPDAADLLLEPGSPLENWFDYGGYQVNLPFLGVHQAANASMAIEIALALWRQGYDIQDEAIIEGLESAFLPARIELMRKEPMLILDGCHNPAGTAALAALLDAREAEQNPVCVLGVMEDKDVLPMLKNLAGRFSRVYTVTPNNPRAMDAGRLARLVERQQPEISVTPCEELEEALEAAASDSRGAVVCGSLYLAAEARPVLAKLISQI